MAADTDNGIYFTPTSAAGFAMFPKSDCSYGGLMRLPAFHISLNKLSI